MPFVSTNPCICPQSTNPDTPNTPSECLRFCDTIISDGGLPCGQESTVNISEGANTSICDGDSVGYSVVDFDDSMIVTASIDNAGMLTFRTTGSTVAGKYAEFTIKICCGIYEAYGKVFVGIQDLCNCPTCQDCEVCDPCTGLCVESLNEFEIN